MYFRRSAPDARSSPSAVAFRVPCLHCADRCFAEAKGRAHRRGHSRQSIPRRRANSVAVARESTPACGRCWRRGAAAVVGLMKRLLGDLAVARSRGQHTQDSTSRAVSPCGRFDRLRAASGGHLCAIGRGQAPGRSPPPATAPGPLPSRRRNARRPKRGAARPGPARSARVRSTLGACRSLPAAPPPPRTTARPPPRLPGGGSQPAPTPRTPSMTSPRFPRAQAQLEALAQATPPPGHGPHDPARRDPKPDQDIGQEPANVVLPRHGQGLVESADRRRPLAALPGQECQVVQRQAVGSASPVARARRGRPPTWRSPGPRRPTPPPCAARLIRAKASSTRLPTSRANGSVCSSQACAWRRPPGTRPSRRPRSAPAAGPPPAPPGRGRARAPASAAPRRSGRAPARTTRARRPDGSAAARRPGPASQVRAARRLGCSRSSASSQAAASGSLAPWDRRRSASARHHSAWRVRVPPPPRRSPPAAPARTRGSSPASDSALSPPATASARSRLLSTRAATRSSVVGGSGSRGSRRSTVASSRLLDSSTPRPLPPRPPPA